MKNEVAPLMTKAEMAEYNKGFNQIVGTIEYHQDLAGRNGIELIPVEETATTADCLKASDDYHWASDWLRGQDGIDVESGEKSNLYYACLD